MSGTELVSLVLLLRVNITVLQGNRWCFCFIDKEEKLKEVNLLMEGLEIRSLFLWPILLITRIYYTCPYQQVSSNFTKKGDNGT